MCRREPPKTSFDGSNIEEQYLEWIFSTSVFIHMIALHQTASDICPVGLTPAPLENLCYQQKPFSNHQDLSMQ